MDNQIDQNIKKIIELFNNKFEQFHKIEFQDIPRYSEWPKKLFGVEKYYQKIKSKEEVIREYNIDKWGKLLLKYRTSNFKCASDVSDYFDGKQEIPCYWNNNFYLLPSNEYSKIQAELIAEIIYLFLPTENIIELGAGFGAMINYIAQKKQFKDINFIGGELTDNGKLLMKKIAQDFKLPVEIFHCDFMADDIFGGSQLPNDSIFFSCFSFAYAKNLDLKFIKKLLKYRPKIIINLEPFYFNNSLNIYHLMIEKYFNINDYNKDLNNLLNKAENNNLIKIIFKSDYLISNNPFIPLSFIIWCPNYNLIKD